jgi:tetratricopeptide (TPR) repeat protein
MKYSEQFTQALKRFKENTTKETCNGPFWSMIIDSILNVIQTEGDLNAFLKSECDLINYGLCPDVCSSIDTLRASIVDLPDPHQFQTLTVWLSRLLEKVLQGDKKDQLSKAIELAKIQMRKSQNDISTLQQDRKQQLQQLLQASPSGQNYTSFLGKVEEIDQMLQDSLKMKKAIARGTFFTVPQKREYFDKEKLLQKQQGWYNSLLDSIQNREAIYEVKKLNDQIINLLEQTLDIDTCITKTTNELQEINKQQQEMSVLEVVSRIRSELEHIRDLAKLSSKRLNIECSPLITEESKHFTLKTISECFDRIIEFDPNVFHNDRVALFGKPQILIVPGFGNAIFDWKNNQILVPLIYPGSNPIASIASGMIEYRLDTDEDKKLLESYSQLPEICKIRSNIQLKAEITKDYITWMTSEYLGYRILRKNCKTWFEHEIAPNKNEIFTPSHCKPFELGKDGFQKLFQSIDSKINNDINTCNDYELWTGSALYYQKGNYEQSLTLLLLIKDPKYANYMVYYNIGQTASKLMKRQEAIDGYSEFIKRNSQGWWSRVAQEHVRRLQG